MEVELDAEDAEEFLRFLLVFGSRFSVARPVSVTVFGFRSSAALFLRENSHNSCLILRIQIHQ